MKNVGAIQPTHAPKKVEADRHGVARGEIHLGRHIHFGIVRKLKNDYFYGQFFLKMEVYSFCSSKYSFKSPTSTTGTSNKSGATMRPGAR